VRAWQVRPLDPAYAVVFLDAIMVKVRDSHVVQSKPAYIAAGIDADGEKHVLGIWLAKTPLDNATAGEGARFWASVMAGLRNRGVRDILIACCDGLAGFEDAICAAFPHAVVQTCVVHLIRNSLRPVARRDAAAVAAGLRTICTAVDADTASGALAAFSASPPGQKYPQAVRVRENAWDRRVGFPLAAAVLPVGAVDLDDPDAGRGDVAGQAGAVAAGALDPDQAHGAESAQPAQQPGIADRGDGELPDAEQPADGIQCGGDMGIAMGVYAASNSACLYNGHCHLFSLVEEVARTHWPPDPVNPGLFPGQADQTGTPVGA
jgi:hypothetical protein